MTPSATPENYTTLTDATYANAKSPCLLLSGRRNTVTVTNPPQEPIGETVALRVQGRSLRAIAAAARFGESHQVSREGVAGVLKAVWQ
jgi:hypothetical protein